MPRIHFFTLLLTFSLMGQNNPLYLDSSADIEDRINDLMARMTLEEKVGQMCQYVGLAYLKKQMDSVQDINQEVQDLSGNVQTLQTQVNGIVQAQQNYANQMTGGTVPNITGATDTDTDTDEADDTDTS